MADWNLPDGCTLRDIDRAMGSSGECDECGRPFSICRCWATEPEDAPGYEDSLREKSDADKQG